MKLHDFLDHHRPAQSPIHRLPAGLKLCLAMAVVAAAISVALPQGWPLLGLLATLLAGAAAAGKIPWAFLAGRLLLLEPFVLGVAVLALFQPQGMTAFLGVLARSALCLLAMILLSATTPFPDLLKSLRQAGIPAILVSVVALMYRYLFVLIDEAGRMTRARRSRTFKAGRARSWKSSASIIGQLFVRSSSRAERVYGSMCARGWR
ncbi:MAG TPA: cobalt ECF transporter T component CbiQ [Elusimicrobia bacterium]|nr:cobalt ECF transporter T component CbiQ [Elusimicrobiota bacterium]HBT60168.1 cobalt ECF transporter T component CbiQ [Elusimicrobiota bacterium]